MHTLLRAKTKQLGPNTSDLASIIYLCTGGGATRFAGWLGPSDLGPWSEAPVFSCLRSKDGLLSVDC